VSVNLEYALHYALEHREEFLSDLKELIRVPSISNSPDHVTDMRRTAERLATALRELGCRDARLLPTAGAPVVYGDLRVPDARSTLLVYSHYDVQPAEDEEAWDSPPFEPQIRGDELFGRGSSDMKGQIVALLAAVRALQAHDALGVNLKFMFEGEEEIGSPSLTACMTEHAELLLSDFALNLDVGFLGPDQPTISYGLRGIASFEIFVTGPSQDLHSGTFGGAVHNPALVLATMLAGLFDENGVIQLPGYYDSVLPMDAEERDKLNQAPMDDAYYLEQTGVPQLWGENGFTPIERVAGRPTCEINGMQAGYLGEGGKTIIPSTASVKITTRLVPNQEPEQVHKQLEIYLQSCMPDTVTWRLAYYGGASPYLADISHPEVDAFAEAVSTTFGENILYLRDGGSVGAAIMMKDVLGVDSILSGFGLPTDNIHAPNEHLHLPTWYRGIDALIHYLSNEKRHWRRRRKAFLDLEPPELT